MLDNAANISVKSTLVSDNQRQMINLVVMVILCGVISLFGSIANVINMVVFYSQGLNTTINISFFSLAVSDLFNLILQQLYNIYSNPLFVKLDLPIVYTQLQFLTIAVPREMFARITCLITAFITAERCLCVVFPLHIKRIITPRITTVVISAIFSWTLASPAPVYFTSYYTWKFYPGLNRTLLGLAFTSYHEITEAFLFFTHALFTLLGFLSVLAFTLILIYKLGQKSVWRQSGNLDQEKTKSLGKRDRAAITLVVLIAGILVACYTPAVMLCLTTLLVKEFSVAGRHYNLYHSLWPIAMLLEVINSSVNIFLYYKMSSKYRQSFNELFSRCRYSDQTITVS